MGDYPPAPTRSQDSFVKSFTVDGDLTSVSPPSHPATSTKPHIWNKRPIRSSKAWQDFKEDIRGFDGEAINSKPHPDLFLSWFVETAWMVMISSQPTSAKLCWPVQKCNEVGWRTGCQNLVRKSMGCVTLSHDNVVKSYRHIPLYVYNQDKQRVKPRLNYCKICKVEVPKGKKCFRKSWD